MTNGKSRNVAEVQELFQRVPPSSLEMEQGALGGILLENQRLHQVMEVLDEGDFYREGHRIIYRSMLALFERGEPIDLMTLVEELKRTDKLERAGGAAYVASLPDLTPTAAHVGSYAKTVREKAVLRTLISTTQEIAARAYEDPADVEDFLDEAEGAIFDVAGKKVRPSFFPLSDVVTATFKTLEKLSERRGLVTGVPTGYTKLDELTAGLHPGDLVIIAGRPGMGKTALALNIARNASVDHKVPVAFFSLEMAREQIAIRLFCSEARINSRDVRSGYIEKNDWGKLIRAANILQDAPVFIDDSAGIGVLEMKAKARRLKAEHNLGLVVVDYLQLMRGKQTRDSSREQEIADISRNLKAMAKELELPVIALSQLNRAVEARQDGVPRLADLRESGAIEQDADVIIFVHRDLKGESTPEERAKTSIIIGKQRNGPIGKIELVFLEQYTRFENYTSADDVPDFGD